MSYTIHISDQLEEGGVAVRTAVFVDEQGFQQEFDDIDAHAFHLLVYDDDTAIAAGRLYTEDGMLYHIGRIAVLPDYRGKHIGQMIVSALEQKAAQCGGTSVSLSAQCRAEGFYKKLGYSKTNDFHMDEFCPHVTMVKSLLT